MDYDSKIRSSVFLGNLLLIVGILVGIFVVHIAVISAVEALWLSKVRCYIDGVAKLPSHERDDRRSDKGSPVNTPY